MITGIATSIAQLPAPDFTYEDLDGKMVSLKDFSGKVVYMKVWASWCPFCIREVSHEKKLKEKIANKDDIVYLNVSIDKDIDAWKKIIEKKKITGPNLVTKKALDSEIMDLYRVRAVPHYVLIDKKGIIYDKNAKRPSEDGIIEDIEYLLEK